MSFTVRLWEEDSDAKLDSDGRVVKTYRRVYLVTTDVARSVATEGYLAAGVGINPGSPYQNDPFATCKSLAIGPGPEKTRYPYLAFLMKYEWATNAPLPLSTDTDPTNRRVLWMIRPQIQSRSIIKDKNGDLIVNSVGDPFRGGIPVDVRLGTAVARKNRNAAGYNKNNVIANSGKLNSVTFLGGEPGTVQVDIEAEEKYEGGYHFWEETYTFAYDAAGWQPRPLNAGFYYLAGGVRDRIRNQHVDENTNDPFGDAQEEVPLTVAGGIVPLDDRPDGCNFVEVEYFGEMDFNDFGL